MNLQLSAAIAPSRVETKLLGYFVIVYAYLVDEKGGVFLSRPDPTDRDKFTQEFLQKRTRILKGTESNLLIRQLSAARL